MLAKSRFIEMFGDVGKDEFGWGLKRLDSCCTINPKKTSETHLTDSLEKKDSHILLKMTLCLQK